MLAGLYTGNRIEFIIPWGLRMRARDVKPGSGWKLFL